MNIKMLLGGIFGILLISFINHDGLCQDPNNLKEYIFVMLKSGPDRSQSEAELKKLQAGHLDNIRSMAESGMLAIAGPFAEDIDWRGILIFNIMDTVKVKSMLNDDPAIKAGRLTFELHPIFSTPGRCLK